MENIYDIRKKEELVFFLSEKKSDFVPSDHILRSAVIVVNLYYDETAERYLEYLDLVPESIDIYIVTSNDLVERKIEAHKKFGRKINLLRAENRGRDISALLVASADIIQQYQYVCYIHDKKAKAAHLKKDIEIWIRNLWENTIASEQYIYNVLQMFEENQEIGMLTPPEPMGEHVNGWYLDAWSDKDFAICRDLADTLMLDCDLDRCKSPITLSTAFWSRTEALKKLLQAGWGYDDFPCEPIPIDGTILHAIERILGYVVQDAGYKTGVIMSEAYAAWSMLFLQDNTRKLFSLLRETLDITRFHDVVQMEKQKERFAQFFKINRNVYLYGAGYNGKKFLKRIRTFGLNPKGFLVSDDQRAELQVDGLSVYKLHELDMSEEDGIIITVNDDLWEEIELQLRARGFSNYIFGTEAITG